MAEKQHADLIVIGAGPGGYSAAFRAADLGRSVVLVDSRPTLGGVCLNEGCIPSKALLHAARVIHEADQIAGWGISLGKPNIDIDALRQRKDAIVSQLTDGLAQLARRRKVRCVTGHAAFAAANELIVTGADGARRWSFDQAIVAAGSSPVRLPGWPKGDCIWDSAAALELRSVPRRLTIVGGGIVGLEMATIYSALGSAVTVVEMADEIAPGAEPEAAAMVRASLEKRNCVVHTGTRVAAVEPGQKTGIVLACEGGFSGSIEADAVVQAVGRRANGTAIEARLAGIEVGQDGTLAVDIQCRTNRSDIFAAGDITGAPMLAHRATHQGKVAAEVACGRHSAFDTTLIPSIAYTDPELAWVGPTFAQLEAEGISFKVARFPWAASARNLASGGAVGLTMIAYSKDSERILGASIVGPSGGELLGEIGLAVEMGATLSDLALTVHAHPTLSETTAFAAERALGTFVDL